MTVELAIAAASGLCGAAVLTAALAGNPVRGLYLYLFAAAILLTRELPVVREKLTVCEPIFACTVLALVLFHGRVRRGPVPLLPAQRGVLTAAGCWLASVFLSLAVNFSLGRIVDLDRSLLEAATYTYGFALSVTFVLYIDTWEKWRTCLLAWCLGGAVVTAVGLTAIFVYAPEWTRDDFSGRISSTQRESGQVASYLGPLLPLVAFALRRPGPSAVWRSPPVRAAGFGLLAGMFVVMLATGSRAAFLITGIAFCGLLVLLFYVAPRQRVRVGATRLVAAGGLLAAGYFVYAVATDTGEAYAAGKTKPWERSIRIFAETFRGERAGIDQNRQEQIERIGENWLDRPAVGAGPGNYGFSTGGHEIHNSYLNVLGEQGLLGVLAFGAWLLMAGNLGWGSYRAAPPGEARVLVLGFLFGCGLLLFYNLTVLGLRQRPLWFINGLLICLPRVLADLRVRAAHRRRAAAARRRAAASAGAS